MGDLFSRWSTTVQKPKQQLSPQPQDKSAILPLHAPSSDPAILKPEYASLFPQIIIGDQWADECKRVLVAFTTARSRYQSVAVSTGVPWYVIASLHYRESGMDFSTYLGNGDPLNAVTVDVPSGRGPFPSWEDGAIDALNYDNLPANQDWSNAGALFQCELYNGFGYRTHHYNECVPPGASPYIWNGCQFYVSGDYVSDGVFSTSKVDDNLGCAALFKILQTSGLVTFAG